MTDIPHGPASLRSSSAASSMESSEPAIMTFFSRSLSEKSGTARFGWALIG
jgi:hypothetical protein